MEIQPSSGFYCGGIFRRINDNTVEVRKGRYWMCKKRIVGLMHQSRPMWHMGSLRKQAESITHEIEDRHPEIEGVVLFGSVARGDDCPWSDLDILIAGFSVKKPSQVLRTLSWRPSNRISLLHAQSSKLDSQFRSDALFTVHLRKEGEILLDRAEMLKRFLARPIEGINIDHELSVQLKHLDSFSDTRRFNGNFLFCLSSLFSIGKAIVMIALAQEGLHVFNREKAFEVFKDAHPEQAREVDRIIRIRPFYNLVTRRRPEPLPFPYKGADRHASQLVRSIRTVIEKSF